MKDPKTTITGVVTAIVGLLAYFDVIIPDSWMMPIIFIGAAVLGWFTKDK